MPSAPILATPPTASGSKGPTQAAAPAQTGAAVAIDPLKLLRAYWHLLAASGVAGIGIAVVAYVLLGRFAPRYTAEVVFEAGVAIDDASQLANRASGAGGTAEVELYMETQARRMTSDTILDEVLDEREFRNTKWVQQFMDGGLLDRQETMIELRDIVHSRVIPDTTWIVVRCSTGEKEDAAAIANTVKDVYLESYTRSESVEIRDLVDEFQRELRVVRGDIEALDITMDRLLGANQVSSLDEKYSVYQYEVLNLQPAIVELDVAIAEGNSQLGEYETLLNAPGGTVFPEAIRAVVEQGPIIQQQEANIASQKGFLRALREDFGDNHREVRRLTSQIRALEMERDAMIETQMADQFRTAIESLRQGVSNNNASLAEINGRLEEARNNMTRLAQTLKRHSDLQDERSARLEQETDLQDQVRNFELILQRKHRIQLYAQASVPDERAFPKLLPVTAVSLVFTVGLVGGLIFLKEIREQRIRGPQDVALIPRTKVLGCVADISLDLSELKDVEYACRDAPQGAIAESIRQVRTALMKACAEHGHRAVLVSSGLPGSGTSSIVANLATNAAAADFKILVIDGNIRRPRVHSIFGMDGSRGLGDILLGEAEVGDCIEETGTENLSVLCAGTRDARVYERLGTIAMQRVIDSLRGEYDLVLIDAPPAVVASDALAMAHLCDASILVTRAFSEKRGLVARLRNQLSETRAEFLGVIVNAVKPSAGGYFKRNSRATHEYVRFEESEESAAEEAVEEKAKKPKKAKKDKKKRKAKGGEDAASVSVVVPSVSDEYMQLDDTPAIRVDGAEIEDSLEISLDNGTALELDDLDLDFSDEDLSDDPGDSKG
jgi:capsular exopolysaccharide synthesis family protein